MGAFDKLIAASARKHGVSEEYLRKLIQYESKGDPNAVSPTGVRGVAQITGATGKSLGLNKRNFTDPAAQIDAAAQLAKKNEKTFVRIMGRYPTDDELYLGHLQGAGGVTKGLQNPNKLARDLWPEAVKSNTPASAKGRLNTLTAQEYQDLHKRGFNKGGSASPAGTIDIGDQPSLKQLNPNANPSKSPFTPPVIPLSQLAPTEANTMARSKHPGYDEAIKQAIAEGTENVQMAPSSFIPRATDIKGRPTAPDIRGSVQLAGAVPTGVTRPKVTKAPKTKANQAVKEAAEQEAPLPNREGPYDRTAPGTRGMEGGYKDYVKSEQERMAAEAKRAKELRSVPSAGEQIGGPANPRGVRTESFRRPAAAAVGAGAVTGVGAVDPAVKAVQDTINNPQTDYMMPPGGTQAVGPQPVTAARRPAPSIDQDMVNGALKQAMPVIQEVMKDPQAGPAAQVVLKKAAEVQARRAALQADMQNDPTYYQQMAARRQQMPGGGGGGDPLADRAMERAVMMDRPSRGMPQPPAGTVTVGEAVETPEQGDTTENQIVQQALNPQSVYTKRMRPTAAGAAAPSPSGYQLPPGAGDVSGGVQGMPNAGQMPMDPAMMQLMQFFTGGGGNVG